MHAKNQCRNRMNKCNYGFIQEYFKHEKIPFYASITKCTWIYIYIHIYTFIYLKAYRVHVCTNIYINVYIHFKFIITFPLLQ